MRLHVLSDLHLEHAAFALPDVDSEVLVLAGDVFGPGRRAIEWAARPDIAKGRPVVFVAGNHESYDAVHGAERDAMRRAAAAAGVLFLDRGTTVVGDVRFLGCTLWTDFAVPIATETGPVADVATGLARCAARLADYRLIRCGDAGAPRLLRPEDTLALHRVERDWLEEALGRPFAGKTVVVTHHAPHHGSLAPAFEADWVSTGFVNQLPDAFFDVPDLWIHGHTHTRFDYRAGRCRVLCNPRGYPRRDGRFEVEGFDPALVVSL